MEENQEVVNDQPQDSNVVQGEQDEAQPKKDFVAYESYRKVVGKVKKTQSENEALLAKLQQYEEEKAQIEGRKDDVIKSLRQRAEEAEKKLKDTQSTFVWNAVSGNIKAEAIANGCVDADALIRLLGSDDLKSIDYDDSFNVNKDDVGRLMEKASKTYPYLFKKTGAKVNDATPNFEKKELDVKSMSLEDKMKLLAKSLA